jgi:hypothetical protein
MKAAKLIFVSIFILFLISNTFASDSKQVLKSTNWQLTIYDYKNVESKIPVVCGLTTISTRKGEVGIIIEAQLQPSKSNTIFVIDLMKDYKIKSGTKDFNPADMCVSTKDNNITLSQSAGRLTDLSQKDFPVKITISYLIPKSDSISFSIEDSEPLLIK